MREIVISGENYLEFIIPLFVQEEHWGVFRLGLSTSQIDEEIVLFRQEFQVMRHKDMVTTLTTLLFFCTVCSVIVFLLSMNLTRPLIQLTESAKRLASGNFKDVLFRQRNSLDEISVLEATLGEMSTKLISSYEKLTKYSNNLEHLVTERTREPSQANTKLHSEIVERKGIEKDLQKAKDELEEKVRERTTRLFETNKELEKEISERIKGEELRQTIEIKAHAQNKLATLGEIATGIAHEINQPLSYLQIVFQTTLRDFKADNYEKDEIIEDCRESLKQIGRISIIIDHLRTFGRDDAFVLSPVSLEKIINNSLILMGQRIKLKNINLLCNIEENLPTINGNGVRLEQVLINLLQNSVDALKDSKNGVIEIYLKRIGSNVELSFSDNGDGIPENILDKIFLPFFSTKDVGKGTGLGLSIVYGIILEHLGQIECLPSEKGTCFLIKLPVASAVS